MWMKCGQYMEVNSRLKKVVFTYNRPPTCSKLRNILSQMQEYYKNSREGET